MALSVAHHSLRPGLTPGKTVFCKRPQKTGEPPTRQQFQAAVFAGNSFADNSATDMFLGEYTHTLDAKGRLTIPSKYRNELAAGMVLTRNPVDRCLLLFPQVEWDRLADKVSALPLTDPRSAAFRRAFFSAAEDAEPDGQGRILLSSRLRSHAQIQGDVVVAGMNKFIELWAPALWEEKVTGVLVDVDFTGDFFGTLSL
jgi:MraZ protein